MDKFDKPRGGRRDFLRALGAGAAIAVTASGPLAESVDANAKDIDERRKARYRESKHVKTFYRVNRYPS
jgi:hypothetical protein